MAAVNEQTRGARHEQDRRGLNFLAGGGEMGARTRAFDWTATSLGAPADWPQSLKTAVRLLLSSGHPMFIWWGPDLIQFYNDAYARSIGPERHPSALGDRGRDCWAEIWEIIGPQIAQVMAGGEPTWHENHLVPITRNGAREDVWWTYSYSPIDEQSEASGVGGVLVICAETTARVQAERQIARQLEDMGRLFDQAPTFMALLQGREQRFQLANPSFVRLVGGRELLGKTVAEALPEVRAQGFLQLLDDAFQTGRPYNAVGLKYDMQVEPGGPVDERYVDFVYQPITGANGAVTGIFVEGVDVTDRTRAAAALRESEDRFRTLADHIPTLCWMAAPDGAIFWYNPRWYEYTGTRPEDQEGWGWETVHDPLMLPQVMARWQASLRNGEPFEMTFPLKGADGIFRPFLTRVVPLRDEGGAIVRWFGTNTDITEQLRQESHLRLMVEELNHRVKNTLATVQSVVHQTLRRESVSSTVRETLTSRLIALSRAHDVLTNENWSGADLMEIVVQAAAPYESEGGERRFHLQGPPVRLSPRAAIAIAMALHELATNAAKYGALSTADGHVGLNWTVDDALKGLRLVWRERGGPPVSQPTRIGFGTRLIQQGLASELRGRVEVDYAVDGVVCTIEATITADPSAEARPQEISEVARR